MDEGKLSDQGGYRHLNIGVRNQPKKIKSPHTANV